MEQWHATYYDKGKKMLVRDVIGVEREDGRVLFPHVATGSFYISINDGPLLRLPNKDWKEIIYEKQS